MGIDIFTLNKAKRYTNLVALGLASATVDDANKSITFTLASDGSQHTIHFSQPSDGQDGISVTGISDKGNGVFTLLFSDGSESDPIQTILSILARQSINSILTVHYIHARSFYSSII